MKVQLKILLLANYLNIFSFAFFSPLYALFIQKFDSNPLTISITWGFLMIIQGLLTILFGYMINDYRRKDRIIVLGYVCMAIGAFLLSAVESLPSLYIALAYNACSGALVSPAFKAYFSTHELKGDEAREWSIFDGGNLLLAGIGGIIGGSIMIRFGFSGLFYTIGGMQLIAALVSTKILKD